MMIINQSVIKQNIKIFLTNVRNDYVSEEKIKLT